MNKKDEAQESFKVVDKRGFSEPAKETKKNVPLSTPKSSVDRPKIDFSIFVQSMAHQSMMGLGLVPWHDSGLIKTDLTMACETIEILEMLKEKSEGNLNKDEESLITGLLYQLKIAFVEVSGKSKKPEVNGGIII